MLGLRLDQPLDLESVEGAFDPSALERLGQMGLLERDESAISLTRRGRLLGGGVTVELLAERSETRVAV
jgi:coproporphyrinogen III oxidase-like Fe-S oxidoreductase